MENPREEYCHFTTMWCWHKRYLLGDRSTDKLNTFEYSSWQELKKAVIEKQKAVAILPLFMLDHSGITINTTGFNDPWDSGQVGFIFVTRQQMNELGYKRLSKKAIETMQQAMLADVNEYDSYLRGEEQ